MLMRSLRSLGPLAFALCSACTLLPPRPEPPRGAGWSTLRQGYSTFSAISSYTDDGRTRTLSAQQTSTLRAFLPTPLQVPKPTLTPGTKVTAAALAAQGAP
jgi:outer membrane biogenesis lipoprotein LolB